jgi:hypothetical protein
MVLCGTLNILGWTFEYGHGRAVGQAICNPPGKLLGTPRSEPLGKD